MFRSLTPILNRPAHPRIPRKKFCPGYFFLLCRLNEDLSCTSFNYQLKKVLKALRMKTNMRIIDVHLKSTAKKLWMSLLKNIELRRFELKLLI